MSLILCTDGEGWHQIDFVRHRLEPGRLLHVHPGQVQQWCFRAPMEGLLFIFDPGFLLPERGDSGQGLPMDAFWPTSLWIPEADRPRILGAFQDLHQEYLATDGSLLSTRLLQYLLHALLLRLRQTMERFNPPKDAEVQVAVYRLFLEEVERSYARTRDVGDYAQRIGYSARTLSRAALAMQGKTAKNLIDDRVVLEAKRLLAHTGLSISQIAEQLGFTESTNFVKFFQRIERTSPGDFRQQQKRAM